jgi:hypothetical protein
VWPCRHGDLRVLLFVGFWNRRVVSAEQSRCQGTSKAPGAGAPPTLPDSRGFRASDSRPRPGEPGGRLKGASTNTTPVYLMWSSRGTRWRNMPRPRPRPSRLTRPGPAAEDVHDAAARASIRRLQFVASK